MAIERFINDFQTALSSGIDDTTTSIPVDAATSIASQFRAKIDNEIILVTANGDTTTWTATRGAEGTSNVSHSSGATVTVVLTAGAIQQMVSDQVRTGTYSARPSDSDGVAGQVYIPTDSIYEKLVHNGSAWQHYYQGKLMTVPPSSGWIKINQLTATESFADGSMLLIANKVSAIDDLNIWYRTPPSVPYTITIRCLVDIGSGYGGAGVGLGFGDSAADASKKWHFLRLLNASIATKCGWNSAKYNTFQSFNSDYIFTPGYRSLSNGVPVSIQITDDNVDRFVRYSSDHFSFNTVTQVTRTDFLTPSVVAVFVDSGGTTNSTNYALLRVISWEES